MGLTPQAVPRAMAVDTGAMVAAAEAAEAVVAGQAGEVVQAATKAVAVTPQGSCTFRGDSSS